MFNCFRLYVGVELELWAPIRPKKEEQEHRNKRATYVRARRRRSIFQTQRCVLDSKTPRRLAIFSWGEWARQHEHQILAFGTPNRSNWTPDRSRYYTHAIESPTLLSDDGSFGLKPGGPIKERGHAPLPPSTRATDWVQAIGTYSPSLDVCTKSRRSQSTTETVDSTGVVIHSIGQPINPNLALSPPTTPTTGPLLTSGARPCQGPANSALLLIEARGGGW